MHSKKVLRYYCDHCGKGFWRKPLSLEHEKICYYNPENECCGSCDHFEDWHCLHFDKSLRVNLAQIPEGEEYLNYMLFQKHCGSWKPQGSRDTY
jgi:hypothetical protein